MRETRDKALAFYEKGLSYLMMKASDCWRLQIQHEHISYCHNVYTFLIKTMVTCLCTFINLDDRVFLFDVPLWRYFVNDTIYGKYLKDLIPNYNPL